jgi:hypothetical protein
LAVIDEPTHPSEGNSMTAQRPLVVIDYTQGTQQWMLTSPGEGDPEVFILDFDDEADVDWLEETVSLADSALAAMTGRFDDQAIAVLSGDTEKIRALIVELHEEENDEGEAESEDEG